MGNINRQNWLLSLKEIDNATLPVRKENQDKMMNDWNLSCLGPPVQQMCSIGRFHSQTYLCGCSLELQQVCIAWSYWLWYNLNNHTLIFQAGTEVIEADCRYKGIDNTHEWKRIEAAWIQPKLIVSCLAVLSKAVRYFSPTKQCYKPPYHHVWCKHKSEMMCRCCQCKQHYQTLWSPERIRYVMWHTYTGT